MKHEIKREGISYQQLKLIVIKILFNKQHKYSSFVCKRTKLQKKRQKLLVSIQQNSQPLVFKTILTHFLLSVLKRFYYQ